jgi:hypothetical protein
MSNFFNTLQCPSKSTVGWICGYINQESDNIAGDLSHHMARTKVTAISFRARGWRLLMPIEEQITRLTADEINALRHLLWNVDRNLDDETLRTCIQILTHHLSDNYCVFMDTALRAITMFLQNPRRHLLKTSDTALASFADGINSYFDALIAQKTQ